MDKYESKKRMGKLIRFDSAWMRNAVKQKGRTYTPALTKYDLLLTEKERLLGLVGFFASDITNQCNGPVRRAGYVSGKGKGSGCNREIRIATILTRNNGNERRNSEDRGNCNLGFDGLDELHGDCVAH
jgi:hypothetical protein